MSIYLRPDDIVAYQYRADLYCAACVQLVMPTWSGGTFDGWAASAPMPTEEFLDGIAQAFGIDRLDEHTFDSDHFAKVVFRDQAADDDHCGRCHAPLL